MLASSRCLLAAAVSLCALQSAAQAQSVPTPDLVVTATRSPQAITRAGSAISVITADDIEKQSPATIVDALRGVSGLSVVENGGPGSNTTVRLRGAESRHTLVLIDGVRISDPSQPGNEFDFANLVPTDIERIEVLRGPQSALYGSDALGGVINIITRKGKGAPRVTMSAEGGSYGTKAGRAGVSGSTGPLSYAFSLTGFDTAGFSRYGYRIGRIEGGLLGPLEPDSARRLGASGRVGVALAKDVELEIGGYVSLNQTQFDAAFQPLPDTASRGIGRLYEGHTRLTALTFDGLLRNTVLVSASRTDRDSYEISGFGEGRYGFTGDRLAAEYQGDLKLGAFGLLTLGGKIERERLLTEEQPILPFPAPLAETRDASAQTRSIFALHQISLWQNLHLSLGGRIDSIESRAALCTQNGVCDLSGRPETETQTFPTWRATAAYEIPEAGTTLRSSIGTGAKAPSLYQQFGPIYGTPGLEPEYSFGMDVGIDQRLFEDRLTLSATLFSNRFRDLIGFEFASSTCPPSNPFGCYLNIDRARTSGLELAADVDVIPQWLRVKAVYTYTDAINLLTDERLARRPEHEGRVGFVVTPVPGLSIEPAVILVGERFSSSGEQDRLAPYARFDIYADYKVNDTFSVFARAENITDAEYQNVYNYGTAGRSFYGGMRATW